MTTLWSVDQSHIVQVPTSLKTKNLIDLRAQLQTIADDHSSDFGSLHYRYELDAYDAVFRVHTYFMNKHGLMSRFMKLTKID